MSAAVRIGFHPLIDSAILHVARDGGMFAAEGLDVTLSREASWSNIRDKLAYGLLEAAHILAPMPIASALGMGSGGAARLIAPMAMGFNGNSIVAGEGLAREIGADSAPAAATPAVTPAAWGAAIARAVRARAASGRPPLVFGVPFLFSAHMYVVRQWLSEAGIDTGRDVSIVVAPPVRMASMAQKGVVDAFCVGAPWGQATVLEGAGRLLFSDRDYWAQKPEKLLAVAFNWADSRPETMHALLRALLRAAVWADAPGNRAELARILAEAASVGAPAAAIEAALDGPLSGGHVFAAGHATYPWRQHGRWFARQMLLSGHTPAGARPESVAASIYRPDLWRIAAASVGLAQPDEGAAPLDAAGHVLP